MQLEKEVLQTKKELIKDHRRKLVAAKRKHFDEPYELRYEVLMSRYDLVQLIAEKRQTSKQIKTPARSFTAMSEDLVCGICTFRPQKPCALLYGDVLWGECVKDWPMVCPDQYTQINAERDEDELQL